MAHVLHTFVATLLSLTSDVHLDKVTVEQDTVRLQLTATAPTAACPRCAVSSSSLHSRYQRHLTDLPWGRRSVHLQLTVRKFFCRNATCSRHIFTERRPDLIATYARKTHRLITALRAIGVALGGNAGARLAARLRLPTSPATLLRLVRTTPVPSPPALQAVGVDEWAWRRGHRYGTILVNLADHRVVDLLPDRSAATVAAWLAAHPTISVVCRDRSDLYADGMRRGAPQAVTTMARQLGISRPTVYAYLRRDTPPGPRRLQRPPSARVLTPYVPYLIRRWRESGADSRQLWREIQTLGYTHSARTVGRFITRLRRAADAGQPPESQRSPYMRPQGPSARAVSFVMVCPAAKRSAEAQTYLDQLCQMDARSTRAHELTQGFLALVRERRGRDLKAWITAATGSGLDGLARFAQGLQQDLAAVTAGLTLPWSNGVTEGQIHRLKLLKRQAYGRAGFALLRQRTLQAA